MLRTIIFALALVLFNFNPITVNSAFAGKEIMQPMKMHDRADREVRLLARGTSLGGRYIRLPTHAVVYPLQGPLTVTIIVRQVITGEQEDGADGLAIVKVRSMSGDKVVGTVASFMLDEIYDNTIVLPIKKTSNRDVVGWASEPKTMAVGLSKDVTALQIEVMQAKGPVIAQLSYMVSAPDDGLADALLLLEPEPPAAEPESKPEPPAVEPEPEAPTTEPESEPKPAKVKKPIKAPRVSAAQLAAEFEYHTIGLTFGPQLMTKLDYDKVGLRLWVAPLLSTDYSSRRATDGGAMAKPINKFQNGPLVPSFGFGANLLVDILGSSPVKLVLGGIEYRFLRVSGDNYSQGHLTVPVGAVADIRGRHVMAAFMGGFQWGGLPEGETVIMGGQTYGGPGAFGTGPYSPTAGIQVVIW